MDFREAWVPLFLFAVVFGTSMDYHVFLLCRVREHFDETGDNRESVAFGLRRTGGIPRRLRWLPEMRVEPVTTGSAEGRAFEGALAAAFHRE